MSRDDRQYGKYANKTSHRKDGGTAARVRPFSFEEIMMRRNNKEASHVKEEYGRVELKSTIEVVQHFSTSREPDRGDKDSKLSFPYTEKHGSDDRSSSRSKKELPRREGKSTRGIHDVRNHTEDSDMVKSRHKKERGTSKEDVIKGRAKKFPEPEAELRTIASNELRSIKVNRDESYLKHRTGSKHEEKPDNHEQRSKRNRVETDRSIDTWSKTDQRPRNDPKDRAGKDNYRDQVVSDRFVRWVGGSSEKECKRKLHNVDDRKAKNISASKKPNLGKSPDLKVLERKEKKESFGSRYGDAMIKRKRSRSREREQDRNKDRKSMSLSPKAHKHRSSGERTHGELASQCRDDRPGKQHKDGERSKFSSNGLSSTFDVQGVSVTSGLGGYSPRKRKTESAIKTPSPTNRSPEKKRAGWDIPPIGEKEDLSSSAPHGSQSVSLSTSTNVQELVSAVTAALIMPKNPLGPAFLPTRNSASIDSIQLTESTRPMRRLYVENLPTSTSEKALMECLNHLFISSGVNHILGTQPCISCMIHKERCQALVEFLTPEDASAALSFDGSYFSGSVLKIRRPKDFVDMAASNGDTVQVANPAATPSVNLISDIVIDSPQKVFVGGISAYLSAEMLMEIVRAFGPLKAFHLETKENSNERYAFLEYIDPSVTPKACAGLNGMKLGDQILTVVQAVLDSSSTEHAEISTYTVPDHAKPLLENPTTVLKLKNVFTPELVLLSKAEVEDVLEDIRLECARFGTVKSVNVYQPVIACPREMKNEEVSGKTEHEIETGAANTEVKTNEEYNTTQKAVDATTEAEVTSHIQAGCGSEVANHEKTLNDTADLTKEIEPETCLLEEDTSMVEEEDLFESGDVFVEYKRIQGCCLAAHSLHGRLFEDRVVMVEYVPLHLYQSKFSSP